ncbi:MAG: NAD-dependent epimerase/dehydratase family protein [Solirubrobacterales bacterium]|nr:NAD-dependent epimerase/dehydratase family protein [Solirubrobacterales bacterium]
MRLLVTGGAGFVGSNVCLQLAERHPDWEVVALDNLYRRGSELNLPRFRAAGVSFVHADVRSKEDFAAVGPFDAMVECSAEPSVMAGGDVIVPVNLLGAWHCFEAAAAHDAHVIFLSTSRVYPIAGIEALPYEEAETRYELVDRPGIAEDFPLAGARTMYGASKLAGEFLLQEYGFPWTINRCGVIAGPWQMGKVDQGVFTHWVLSHVFDRPLKYIGYGGTGKQVRDLLHVDDLVDLVELQLTERERWAGQTFNVGGGRDGSLSLVETTAICRELTGNDLPITGEAATRAGDVRCYLSDCRALFAHTDWRPRKSPRDVLRDIHVWITNHQDLVLSALG